MKMTAKGFAGMTRIMMDLATSCCDGRIALCLEGGYHLRALQRSITQVLLELTGTTRTVIDEMTARANQGKIDYAVKRCAHVHQSYWTCLRQVADYKTA
jgi:acetoin utilization deacetylase AcuC-like enzyme